jgi:hypothetical protein
MIDACITTLMQGRLFERDIYTEKFFSAADAQQVRSPLFNPLPGRFEAGIRLGGGYPLFLRQRSPAPWVEFILLSSV